MLQVAPVHDGDIEAMTKYEQHFGFVSQAKLKLKLHELHYVHCKHNSTRETLKLGLIQKI